MLGENSHHSLEEGTLPLAAQIHARKKSQRWRLVAAQQVERVQEEARFCSGQTTERDGEAEIRFHCCFRYSAQVQKIAEMEGRLDQGDSRHRYLEQRSPGGQGPPI